ncbi:MAG: helicase-related protein [Pirellulaceae bacterium]|nr:helicase-related protein [Pirellulaceae bacterium]
MLRYSSPFQKQVFETFWPGQSAVHACDAVWLSRCRTFAEKLKICSDSELSHATALVRKTPPATGRNEQSFALAIEAIRRVLGMELYNVQLQAGISLVQGTVTQVQTGEGKTLIAALGAIVNVLTGRKTHVMTVNSYLANRDFQLLSPVFQLLGLCVGLTDSHLDAIAKKLAYQSDIVYGPGYEFGFDYLRDRLTQLSAEKQRAGDRIRKRLRGIQLEHLPLIQGPLVAAIVDEADSVMLDEATTPLLISHGGQSTAPNRTVYVAASDMASQLQVDLDFKRTGEAIQWMKRGLEKLALIQTPIASGLQRAWSVYVQQALRAQHQLERDIHYVVDGDQIQIVDQQTGRIFSERTWNEGLHQAVQAKEGVTITAENHVVARITRQRYLGLYAHLSGLTGTAEGSESELKQIYKLDVIVIQTHRPSVRKIIAPQIFVDRPRLEAALVQEAQRMQLQGRPVLIGTTSIRSTERLSMLFDREQIPHQSLTGRQDSDEAEVIARAGQSSCITIATNMAGRGTDIHVDSTAKSLGGLHVIITELNESSRIERQLIGRTARQGDPGSSQLFISGDDPFLLRYAPELADRIASSNKPCNSMLESWVSAIRRLQTKVEKMRTEERQKMFAHDDWLDSVKREIG